MQIEIHHPCSDVHDAVLRYVEQRARTMLRHFAPYILHVAVYLEEAGQLRPGGGVRCRIVVAVLGAGHVRADVLDMRLTVAIDRALDHLAHTLARDFDRPSIPTVALPVPVRQTPATLFHRLRRRELTEQLPQRDEGLSFGEDLL